MEESEVQQLKHALAAAEKRAETAATGAIKPRICPAFDSGHGQSSRSQCIRHG